MTVNVSPNGPFVIQANTHSSQVLRQVLQSLVPTAGIVNPNDLLVAAHGTPNMSVDVASGFAVIAGSQSSPTQGSYHVYNDATVNLAISPSDQTNARWDLVVLQVRDAAYSGANNDAQLAVVTGTPAGSPALPAAPANSLSLCKVVVAANAGTITGGNLTDLRTVAAPMTGNLFDTTLTGTTASVTISSIPNTGASLQIEISGRSDKAAAVDEIAMQFNGDTAGNYDYQEEDATSSATLAQSSASGATSMHIGYLTAANAVANSLASGRITIPNYGGATLHTGAHGQGGGILGGTTYATGNMYTYMATGIWRSTAAVTSVKLFPAGGNFVAGTRITARLR